MADSDKDGLTDEFERRIGTDPFDKDTDNDGLTDKAERTLGTNPKNYDTDGDGYMDGSEFAQGKSPTHADPPNPYADRYGQRDKPFRTTAEDPDGDGLDEMQERMLKTKPNDPDSDGDGIGDGIESIGNQGRSPTTPEPIPTPKPGTKSADVPTADETDDVYVGNDVDNGFGNGVAMVDDAEPAFEYDDVPVTTFEPPAVEVASYETASDDTGAYAEDDAYVAEEMSSDV
jgi:hypothetical protein